MEIRAVFSRLLPSSNPARGVWHSVAGPNRGGALDGRQAVSSASASLSSAPLPGSPDGAADTRVWDPRTRVSVAITFLPIDSRRWTAQMTERTGRTRTCRLRAFASEASGFVRGSRDPSRPSVPEPFPRESRTYPTVIWDRLGPFRRGFRTVTCIRPIGRARPAPDRQGASGPVRRPLPGPLLCLQHTCTAPAAPPARVSAAGGQVIANTGPIYPRCSRIARKPS
jgi:hypothetical protein